MRQRLGFLLAEVLVHEAMVMQPVAEAVAAMEAVAAVGKVQEEAAAKWFMATY